MIFHDFPKDCDNVPVDDCGQLMPNSSQKLFFVGLVQDAEPHVAPAYPSAMRRAFAYGFGASPRPGSVALLYLGYWDGGSSRPTKHDD